jgi:hypothetical protein
MRRRRRPHQSPRAARTRLHQLVLQHFQSRRHAPAAAPTTAHKVIRATLNLLLALFYNPIYFAALMNIHFYYYNYDTLWICNYATLTQYNFIYSCIVCLLKLARHFLPPVHTNILVYKIKGVIIEKFIIYFSSEKNMLLGILQPKYYNK